jgi:phosphoserine phosphatase RsbU/P
MSIRLQRLSRSLERQPVWLAMALALGAVITAVAIVAGSKLNLADLLAATPLLACARCNGRLTALAAGCAIALSAIVGIVYGGPTTASVAYRFAIVGGAGIFAILAAVTRGRREDTLIRISERVQRAILRPLPAELGGVAFASHYQSASPQALVGGDLYDVTMTSFGPRLIIGDVKGKGLDAVGQCAAILAIFREMASTEPDLVRLAVAMDARFARDIGIEDFVTVILAEFAPGEVRLVNCGHHPPLRLAAGSRELQTLEEEPACPPLGLNPSPHRQDVRLKPGDRLLFYTDGLVEARDPAGRFLVLDHRVAVALGGPDLEAAVQRVVRLLLEHAGGELADDVLLVLAGPLDPSPV